MTARRWAGCCWRSTTRSPPSEELSPDAVDMNDPEQAAIWKTVQILLNKVIYADSYLRVVDRPVTGR